MLNPFLQSLFVRQPVICGLQMLPFSAWHYAALLLHNSPFVVADTAQHARAEDLLLAVYICSLRYPDAHAVDPDQNVLVEVASVLDCDRDGAVFVDYLSEHVRVADVWEKQTSHGHSPARVCTPVMYVSYGMQELGLSREDAWSMPLGELIGYCLACADRAGVIEIVGDVAEQAIRLATQEQTNG